MQHGASTASGKTQTDPSFNVFLTDIGLRFENRRREHFASAIQAQEGEKRKNHKRKNRNQRAAERKIHDAIRKETAVVKIAQIGISAIEQQTKETLAIVNQRDVVASDMACHSLRLQLTTAEWQRSLAEQVEFLETAQRLDLQGVKRAMARRCLELKARLLQEPFSPAA